jgi:hypothetical protein
MGLLISVAVYLERANIHMRDINNPVQMDIVKVDW